jgi:hypothetical protein
MNDLKFVIRELPTSPGFVALEILTLESADQTSDDRQSISKSNCRLGATRRRDSSTLPLPTRREGHFVIFPNAGWDGLGFLGTYGKPCARLAEFRAAIHGRVAKNRLCPARSRMAIELRLRSVRECRRVSLVFCFGLVEKRTQCGSGSRIADNSLPGSITVQLRNKRSQFASQFLTLGRREFLNRGLDLWHSAHSIKLTCRPGSDKHDLLGSTKDQSQFGKVAKRQHGQSVRAPSERT